MSLRMLAIAAALCLLALPAAAREQLGLLTGARTGTYYAFGKDIALVAGKSGLGINVQSSEGSIDNIKRLNRTGSASLGIVQSDVLGFLSRSKNPASIKMASNLRLVFPFYHEEVHVLARRDIASFAQLSGKKVAIGEEGSGNMLTAINLFSMMGVTPAHMEKLSPTQGVVAVLEGNLDAVIFVGGKPVRLFKNLEDLSLPENQRYAAMLEQVHFLPLDDPKMLEEYSPAEITHADYNFVQGRVPTIAVQAVLISYDFALGSKKHCETLGRLAQVLRDQLPYLKQHGHPKWKEVNLDEATRIWKKDSCAWPQTTSSSSVPDARGLLNILGRS